MMQLNDVIASPIDPVLQLDADVCHPAGLTNQNFGWITCLSERDDTLRHINIHVEEEEPGKCGFLFMNVPLNE